MLFRSYVGIETLSQTPLVVELREQETNNRVDAIYLPEIKQALAHSDWHKSSAFARKPSVDFISPNEVNRVIDSTGKLNSPQEITPMGLANLGLDIVGSQSLGENILQRLSRTLSV